MEREPVPEKSVVLTFDVAPPGAAVLLDGKPLAGRTRTIDVDGAARTLRLEVKARGYRPHVQRVRATRDETIVVRLKKAPPPRKTPRKGPGGLIDL